MYSKHIAEDMILKAGYLEVEESQYISYQAGQPSKAELQHLLKARLPERDYEVISQINGTTIKRIQYERDSATSEQGSEILDQGDLPLPGDS
jgi:hypothetical protein